MNLEKTSNLRGNFIARVTSQFRSGGFRKGLDYLSGFKDPTHALPIGKKMPKKIPIMEQQKMDINLTGDFKNSVARGFRTSAGNTAENIRIITKDTKGKSLLGGTGQVLKNTGELLARQVKGDTIKEVKGAATGYIDGKKHVLSNSRFLKDRVVKAETGRGSDLIRKRLPILPLSVAAGGNALAVGGLSYAMSDKEKPQSKRLLRAAKDTALFTPGIPAGIIGSMVFPGEVKEQLKKEN